MRPLGPRTVRANGEVIGFARGWHSAVCPGNASPRSGRGVSPDCLTSARAACGCQAWGTFAALLRGQQSFRRKWATALRSRSLVGRQVGCPPHSRAEGKAEVIRTGGSFHPGNRAVRAAGRGGSLRAIRRKHDQGRCLWRKGGGDGTLSDFQLRDSTS